MKPAQFSRLDLNLLRVLDGVFRTGSVQTAAEELSLTPSAVSHSLARLRAVLDDPLFVRRRGGLSATPYVVRIAPQVGAILRDLQTAIVEPRFVPADSNRHFTVVGSAYMSLVLMPEVIRRVRELAPRTRVSLRSSDSPIVEDLDAGRCDVALGRFGQIPSRFEAEPLFAEEMAWVTRADHPLAKGPVTLEALMATPQLVISVRGDDDNHLLSEAGLERQLRRDDAPALRGLAGAVKRTIALTVPDAPTALHFLQSSDLVALLPLRIVEVFKGAYALHAITPPYPSPRNTMSMIWHRQLGAEPDVRWLRAIISDVASGLADRQATTSAVSS